jgi:hypothetical protein
MGSERYYIEPEFAPHIAALKRFLRRTLALLAEDARRHRLAEAIVAELEDPETVTELVDAFIDVETQIAWVFFYFIFSHFLIFAINFPIF